MKKEKTKKLGPMMVAPVHNLDPTILPEGSAKLRWGGGRGGRGARDRVRRFYLFLGSNKKQRSCDGRGGAQRPVGRGYEPKKTGARSARARTRGQNPLVI